MSTSPFDVAPPTQENVDRKRPLRFVPTPINDYVARLKEVVAGKSRMENWEYLTPSVTLVSDLDGAEEVEGINVKGRTESMNITTALFAVTGEGQDRVVVLDDNADPKRRDDDGASTAYAMANETLVELFQALGILKHGELDLESIGVKSASDALSMLQGFVDTPVQVRVVHEAMRDWQKKRPGDKQAPPLRDDEGKVRYRSKIVNFSPVLNGVVG